MQPTTFYTFTFSPTGTSRKVSEAIARGFGSETTVSVNLSRQSAEATTLTRDVAALFAVPVYGGRVAPTALARLSGVRGDATPAIGVVLYGNRAYDGAVRELTSFLSDRGFIPVAAAAFVGEHSYSTDTFPIAAGRPDAQDCALAEAFGRSVREKLNAGNHSPVDPAALAKPHTPLFPMLRFVRFVLTWRRRQKRHPVLLLPKADAERCTHCGKCALLCPVGAIATGDELRTDAATCIRCCACVKGCPTQARCFDTPFSEALSRNFRKRQKPATLL